MMITGQNGTAVNVDDDDADHAIMTTTETWPSCMIPVVMGTQTLMAIRINLPRLTDTFNY